MNTFKSVSSLVIMSGALLLASCNTSKEKEEVAPKPLDLSFEYAKRIENIGTAASPNGRVQVTVHTHTYDPALSTGDRWGDNDFNMVFDGCSLTNGTGDEIARTAIGQQIIDAFGGPGGILTSRSGSTTYAGYVRYTSLYGNTRVWGVYYTNGQSGGNLRYLLIRD